MVYEPTNNCVQVYHAVPSASEKRGRASPSGLLPSCRAPEPRLQCSTGIVTKSPWGPAAEWGDAGLASCETGANMCVSCPVCAWRGWHDVLSQRGNLR